MRVGLWFIDGWGGGWGDGWLRLLGITLLSLAYGIGLRSYAGF
jgi:hypothetical protein